MRDTGLLRELQEKACLPRSSKRPLKAPLCGLLCRRAPRRPLWSLLFPSSTSSRVSEAADVEDSNSVHGFGYCIRDRRHVPAAEPLVLANSEGLYDNKLQSSGPEAAATSPASPATSSDLAEAPLSDSLAIVPLTPDDDHAQGLRRSIREHKKPRPYCTGAQSEPPDKPPVGKGLQRGFLK